MPEIQISLRAVDLENNAGMFGTSDPMAVVHIVQGDEESKKLGQTEVVKNTLSPKWMQTFTVDYDPNVTTAITVTIYDKEEKSDNKMGSALFDFSGVIAKGSYEGAGDHEGILGKKMRGGGTVYCRLREKFDAGKLHLMLRGVDLKNVEGMFAKSDPFYELCRKEGDKWVSVYKSEFIKNNLSPLWNEAKYELSLLCDGDINLPLLLSVWDHESSGKHQFIGETETSVNELLGAKAFGGGGDVNSADSANNLVLWDKKGKDAGAIIVVNAHLSGVPDDVDQDNVEDADD